MPSTDSLPQHDWLELESPELHRVGRSREALRRFGFVMAGATALLAGYSFWRGHGFAPGVALLSGACLLMALAMPRSLAPVERVWLAFGGVLGAVVTRIILTLTFYLVITPLGLAIRVFSGETLGKKPDSTLKTYWVPIEPDGAGSRPDKPF